MKKILFFLTGGMVSLFSIAQMNSSNNNSYNSFFGLPTANFTFSPSAVDLCLSDAVNFTFTGSMATAWQWNFGDPKSGSNNTSALQNPSHLFFSPGYHPVTLTVSNACGSDMVSQLIYAIENCCAFSPTAAYNATDITLPAASTNTWTAATLPFGTGGVMTVSGTIYLEPDAILTITGTSGAPITIKFGPLGKIIVDLGSRLNITDNVTLTSMGGSCNLMWQGIEVWGDPAKTHSVSQQAFQGKVTITGIAGKIPIIENAHIGVFLGAPNRCIPSPVVKCAYWAVVNGGGIIQTNNVIFRNNGIGIRFNAFTFSNASTISNTQFATSGTLLDGNYNSSSAGAYPNAFNQAYGQANILQRSANGAYLWAVRNVTFTDNFFDNNETGIEGINASCKVLQSAKPIGNLFQNLRRGINLSYINSTPVFFANTIKGNTFNNPAAQPTKSIGIFISGGSGDLIQDNNFGKLTVPQTNNFWGIYLDNSSGFKVVDNNFYKNYTGIETINSASGGGSIANALAGQGNIFTQCNLSVATTQDNSLLTLRCNTTINSGSSPSLYNRNFLNWDGMLGQQGKPATAAQITRPAGNRFNYNVSPSAKKEIESIDSTYKYFHHFAPSTYIPTVTVRVAMEKVQNRAVG